MKIIYELNNIIFVTDNNIIFVIVYAQLYSKISFGGRVGADWGTTPWPELRLVGGNSAFVARGINLDAFGVRF